MDLNTSHVNVQFSSQELIFIQMFYLNTSHVNVQLHGMEMNGGRLNNLNTSHVNVQSVLISSIYTLPNI